MSLPKPIRVQFDQTDRQLLKEVICEYNGGAFLKVLKSTAVNKNFEKMEVWNAITAVFNQVNIWLLKFMYRYMSLNFFFLHRNLFSTS
jgi:hypothetical protein